MNLFESSTLLAFLAAAVVLVLVPGPGTAWIVAQTVAGGTARGLRAGLGLETATLIHALAAGLGLSAILATSAHAFDVLKFAGAAYLLWLGIRAWRAAPAPNAVGPGEASGNQPLPASGGDDGATPVYWRSVATGVLNPKVALFFLAFLPQFVRPERGLVWLQFLVLGGLLSIIGMSHSTLLSVAIGRFGRRLRAHPRLARWRQRVLGTFFVGLGLRLAVQQR
jgi:threonine/homoserine/homoserine lactone efflux protein